MDWLRGIFWLLISTAVVTAATLGGLLVVFLGFVLGFMLKLLGIILFTAAALKSHFNKE